MASRKLPQNTGRGQEIPTFAQLVRESIAAGMTRREAEAHARRILASYDLIEVDSRTGRSRFVTGGPLITEAVKTPRRKRAKGKTRTTKGQSAPLATVEGRNRY